MDDELWVGAPVQLPPLPLWRTLARNPLDVMFHGPYVDKPELRVEARMLDGDVCAPAYREVRYVPLALNVRPIGKDWTGQTHRAWLSAIPGVGGTYPVALREATQAAYLFIVVQRALGRAKLAGGCATLMHWATA